MINRHDLEAIKKQGRFIDVSKFNDIKYPLCVIVADKGTGKSYSAMQQCIDNIEKGKEFAWIRNTRIEMMSSNVRGSFIAILNERKLSSKYYVSYEGVYRVLDNKQQLLVGMFVYMSQPLNTASQNALSKCDLIVYDEIINPTFTMRNMFQMFLTMLSTLKRKNIARVFLLGNKHTSQNDILDGLGIEFAYEENGIQIFKDKSMGVQAYWLGGFKPKAFTKAQQQIERLAKYSKQSQDFFKGNTANNVKRAVVNWDRNHLKDIFEPLWKFTLMRANFIVGYCHEDNNTILYVKDEWDSNEYAKLRYYCFLPQDKESYNQWINPAEDTSKIETVLNNFNRGNLYYSSCFAKETIRLLLPILKIIKAKKPHKI